MVVNDDMPLLVEAVLTVVEAHGLSVSRIDHPVMAVARDEAGTLSDIGAGPDRTTESWIYVVAMSTKGDVDTEALRTELADVIARVADIDRDAVDMRGRLSTCGADCAVAPTTAESGIAAVDRYEYSRLLDWFAGNHFVPLGYRRVGVDGAVSDGRGLWRGDSLLDLTQARDFGVLTQLPLLPRVSRVYLETGVQRSNYPILIQIPEFDAAGTHVGEHRFLGTFTSSGLHLSLIHI